MAGFELVMYRMQREWHMLLHAGLNSTSTHSATLKRTGPQGCTGPYRALRCSVIGLWAGFIWSAVINIDYRIPDDTTEA